MYDYSYNNRFNVFNLFILFLLAMPHGLRNLNSLIREPGPSAARAWDPLHSFKTLSQCNSVFSSTLSHKIPSICFPESLSSICSTPEVHLTLSGLPLHSQVGIVGVYLIQGSQSFVAWCALFWRLLSHIYCLVFSFFSGKRVIRLLLQSRVFG